MLPLFRNIKTTKWNKRGWHLNCHTPSRNYWPALISSLPPKFNCKGHLFPHTALTPRPLPPTLKTGCTETKSKPGPQTDANLPRKFLAHEMTLEQLSTWVLLGSTRLAVTFEDNTVWHLSLTRTYKISWSGVHRECGWVGGVGPWWGVCSHGIGIGREQFQKKKVWKQGVASHQGGLSVWLYSSNPKLSLKRWWRGRRSQEAGDEGDYIPNATTSPPEYTALRQERKRFMNCEGQSLRDSVLDSDGRPRIATAEGRGGTNLRADLNQRFHCIHTWVVLAPRKCIADESSFTCSILKATVQRESRIPIRFEPLLLGLFYLSDLILISVTHAKYCGKKKSKESW